jgi:hypothetical protein
MALAHFYPKLKEKEKFPLSIPLIKKKKIATPTPTS